MPYSQIASQETENTSQFKLKIIQYKRPNQGASWHNLIFLAHSKCKYSLYSQRYIAQYMHKQTKSSSSQIGRLMLKVSFMFLSAHTEILKHILITDIIQAPK